MFLGQGKCGTCIDVVTSFIILIVMHSKQVKEVVAAFIYIMCLNVVFSSESSFIYLLFLTEC